MFLVASKRKKSGLSLIDVLVGATLMVLLFTMIYQILVPSMVHTEKARATLELQQHGMKALDHVARRISRSASYGISIHQLQIPDPENPTGVMSRSILGMNLMSGVGGGGWPTWEPRYYIYGIEEVQDEDGETKNQLVELVFEDPNPGNLDLSRPTEPVVLSGAELVSRVAVDLGDTPPTPFQRRVLAEDVENFTIESVTPGQERQSPFRMRVHLRREAKADVVDVNMVRDVTLRVR